MAVSQYQVRQVCTRVLASMDLSEVRTSEDASTQVRSLCIWNGSILDYVKYVDVATKNIKNDRFLFFCSSQPLSSMPVCATAKKNLNQNIEDILKMDRAVLALAVGPDSRSSDSE